MHRIMMLISMVVLVSMTGLQPMGQASEKGLFFASLQQKITKFKPAEESIFYWKGEEVRGPLSQAELEMIEQAISAARQGREAQARGLLEQFILEYPQSLIREDAVNALNMLKQGSEQQKEPLH